MELADYRRKLDDIDQKLLDLFIERMNIASEIALLKKRNNLPVLDVRREQEKLQQIEACCPRELAEYSRALFSTLMEFSRSQQNRILNSADGKAAEHNNNSEVV